MPNYAIGGLVPGPPGPQGPPGPSGIATTLGVNVQTANYTPTATDQIVQMNAGTPCTVSLPTPLTTGQIYYIKNIAENTCTVDPPTGTIDGNASIVLAQYQGITVYWDGSAWHLLSQSLSV